MMYKTINNINNMPRRKCNTCKKDHGAVCPTVNATKNLFGNTEPLPGANAFAHANAMTTNAINVC